MMYYSLLALVSILSCFSIAFLYIQSPLGMGMCIVFTSLIISGVLYIAGSSSWFSFLLFMVFLSGMMVLFIYVCSLAANEVSFSEMMFPFFSFFLLSSLSVLLLSFNFTFLNGLSECVGLSTYSIISKIYAPFMFLLTMIMILYLLVALLVVVKNSLLSEGPLRAKK